MLFKQLCVIYMFSKTKLDEEKTLKNDKMRDLDIYLSVPSYSFLYMYLAHSNNIFFLFGLKPFPLPLYEQVSHDARSMRKNNL